jgi:hypothetical protein
VDALLLQHIGVAWQVKLKDALLRIFDSRAWIRPSVPSLAVKENRTAQLRQDDGTASINVQRETMRRNSFFLTQLQTAASVPTPYDDLVDAPEESESESENAISPAEVKQQLLQIMTTECYLNTSLHGTHAVLCSDLEWFGPSLPHTSILAIFEFLGMSKAWLRFYKAFLSAPIRFPGDPEPRVRKRGTPISYSLSVVCGEVVVFIMDFAVNQRANGLYLYRMHDDLWLWDADVRKVADGWAEMQEYAALVGLKFNQKKTGSAYIGPQDESSSLALGELPVGDIRWGFLKFDPTQKRFRLDQAQVDEHIVEMRRQLASAKSVFGWVNAYNKYMMFFFRNFGGTPAKCFGTAHIGELVETFARIQQELFPLSAENPTGGVVGYLRRILEERFDVKDLPEGYFYFPIGSGGLELRNTMLEILALERREKPLVTFGIEDSAQGLRSVDEESTTVDEFWDSKDYTTGLEPPIFVDDDHLAGDKFAKHMEHDQKDYARAKEVWDEEADNHRQKFSPTFMSFEEYASLRETWLRSWGESYRNMLGSPGYLDVRLVPEIKVLMDQLPKPWLEMDWYEKWVVSMYGEGVIRKYGSLKAVHPDLIPVGMVELFRTSRMKLDQ